jgi:hypothetical protein
MDSSTSGYRIEWPDTIETRIRTGEVIGVKTDDYENWRIAVVRWLRSDESHQMGVEVIASAATAYSARAMHSGLASGDFQRALLIPGRDSGPLVMLTNITGFATGQTVELIRPGHVMRIKLDEIVDSSTAYKLFAYTDTNRQQTSSVDRIVVKRSDDDDNEGDFNKLWDIL